MKKENINKIQIVQNNISLDKREKYNKFYNSDNSKNLINEEEKANQKEKGDILKDINKDLNFDIDQKLKKLNEDLFKEESIYKNNTNELLLKQKEDYLNNKKEETDLLDENEVKFIKDKRDKEKEIIKIRMEYMDEIKKINEKHFQEMKKLFKDLEEQNKKNLEMRFELYQMKKENKYY